MATKTDTDLDEERSIRSVLQAQIKDVTKDVNQAIKGQLKTTNNKSYKTVKHTCSVHANMCTVCASACLFFLG